MIIGLLFLSGRVLNARHLTPLGERSFPKQAIMRGFHVVTTNTK
jgi:hypothetical protein